LKKLIKCLERENENEGNRMTNGHDLADFLQRFSTKVLWHFTGYAKTDEQASEKLQLIIKSKTLELSKHPEQVIMVSGEKRWVYTYS